MVLIHFPRVTHNPSRINVDGPANTMTRAFKRGFLSTIVSVAGLVATACSHDSQILIEFDGETPIFIVDQPSLTWGVPPARMDGLAVANEKEAFWEIRSIDESGVEVGGSEIIYGQLPEGFEQITPSNGGRAKDIYPGESYYLGATGPDDATWRAIFALPVGRYGIPPKPDFEPEEAPAKIDVSKPEPAAKIAE